MDNIIILFLENVHKEFHIREIARIVKKAPTTVSKYLYKLEKERLLISKFERNHKIFIANIENENFKDLKIYYNIKKIRSSGLLSHLEEGFNHPEAIVLFGSFRKGEDIEKSDIDLLIITSLKKNLDLSRFEKKLRHNIQPFLLSKNEIDSLKKKNKELLNNMINGIVLYGFWEVFR